MQIFYPKPYMFYLGVEFQYFLFSKTIVFKKKKKNWNKMKLFPNPTSINICTNVAYNQQSCYKNFAEVEQPNLIKWSNLIPNLSVPFCTKFYNHIEELLGWQKRNQLVKYLIRMFPRLFHRTMFASTLVQGAMTNSFWGLCRECNLNPWHLI